MKTYQQYNETIRVRNYAFSSKDMHPELGDYVICSHFDDDVNNFMKNNVGQVVSRTEGAENRFDIYYKNARLPQFTNGHVTVPNYRITHISDDKEELELMINANKYNL